MQNVTCATCAASVTQRRLYTCQEITEAAMRGELDFFGSLKSRVALLKGTATTCFCSAKLVATGVNLN